MAFLTAFVAFAFMGVADFIGVFAIGSREGLEGQSLEPDLPGCGA
jgi:hypothetical protein